MCNARPIFHFPPFYAELFQPVPESPGEKASIDFSVNTRHMDPAKAKQAERLGMGMGTRRYVCLSVCMCLSVC